jgi:hypothetical protein
MCCEIFMGPQAPSNALLAVHLELFKQFEGNFCEIFRNIFFSGRNKQKKAFSA